MFYDIFAQQVMHVEIKIWSDLGFSLFLIILLHLLAP